MIEAQFNFQNDKVLEKSADNIPDFVRSIYHHQIPVTVMIWVANSKTWKFYFCGKGCQNKFTFKHQIYFDTCFCSNEKPFQK